MVGPMSNYVEQPVVNTDGTLGNLIVDVLVAFTKLEMKLRSVLHREGFDRKKNEPFSQLKTGFTLKTLRALVQKRWGYRKMLIIWDAIEWRFIERLHRRFKMNKWIRWALLALAACIVSYLLQSLFGTTRLISVIAGMGFFICLGIGLYQIGREVYSWKDR